MEYYYYSHIDFVVESCAEEINDILYCNLLWSWFHQFSSEPPTIDRPTNRQSFPTQTNVLIFGLWTSFVIENRLNNSSLLCSPIFGGTEDRHELNHSVCHVVVGGIYIFEIREDYTRALTIDDELWGRMVLVVMKTV